MEHRGAYETNHSAIIVEQQLRSWNARRAAARKNLKDESKEESGFRFLTIARDEGCLGNEIAQELARRLGWHVFDKEIVACIAKSSHVREIVVHQLDQKSQGLIEDAISRFLRMPEYASFGTDEYREALLRTLVSLAVHGSAILVGRGANFILRENEQGLNVRLTASSEVRIQRLSKIWKATPEETGHRMEADDVERRKFIRHYFNQDFDDRGFYDIIYNTDRASAACIASSILAFMDIPQAGTAGSEQLEPSLPSHFRS
jgi:cytidylate kinase